MHYLIPYRRGSRSVRRLILALGGRLYSPARTTTPADLVINWGCTDDTVPGSALNPPSRLLDSSNKRRFFIKMAESGCRNLLPEFWLDTKEIPDEKFPIVCRTVLAGHSGAGIVIASDRSRLVPARLYVAYTKKSDEYRIHLGKDPSGGASITIAVQRKARRHDHPNPDWQIRNHANGFVYARENVNPPPVVVDAARACFDASGLDFGAVDVIYNSYQGRAYVLEINTAPGLEGSTVDDYAAYFRNYRRA